MFCWMQIQTAKTFISRANLAYWFKHILTFNYCKCSLCLVQLIYTVDPHNQPTKGWSIYSPTFEFIIAPQMLRRLRYPSPHKQEADKVGSIFYSLLIAKDHFYSCIFSMVSSLYLPFSFPSARDLALRSRIFLRSLSSFSLVMTTCKEEKD